MVGAAAVALGAFVLTESAADAVPMRILVTNDDGVHSAGIDALVEALRQRADTAITVVAPATNQSGTAGRMTPGRLRAVRTTTRSGHAAIAVRGTPAASVRYALDRVLRDAPPDLVVSGINDGANLGPVATRVSGTVGAARYAARRGLPALASSQGARTRGPTRFGGALAVTLTWLDAHAATVTPGTVTSINAPSCSRGRVRGLRETVLVRRLPTGADFHRSVDCAVTTVPGPGDAAAFLAGFASVTPVPPR